MVGPEPGRSMADMYKIMLSSTYMELKEHRAAVREAMLSQRMFPIAMEVDAALPDQDLIDASLAKVDESDGYVGLISYRYGQTPACPDRNPEVPFTNRTRISPCAGTQYSHLHVHHAS